MKTRSQQNKFRELETLLISSPSTLNDAIFEVNETRDRVLFALSIIYYMDNAEVSAKLQEDLETLSNIYHITGDDVMNQMYELDGQTNQRYLQRKMMASLQPLLRIYTV